MKVRVCRQCGKEFETGHWRWLMNGKVCPTCKKKSEGQSDLSLWPSPEGDGIPEYRPVPEKMEPLTAPFSLPSDDPPGGAWSGGGGAFAGAGSTESWDVEGYPSEDEEN